MAHVLIVDDNEKSLDLLNDFIGSWGYKTSTASQGMEAINLAKEQRPDVIVLDVMLPGMSGYEVCLELKNEPATRMIPIVLVTALTDVENRIHAFNVGADHFMSKPVNYKELRAVIECLLRKMAWLNMMENKVAVLDTLVAVAAVFVPQHRVDVTSEKYVFYHKLLNYLRVNATTYDQVMTVVVLSDLGKAIESAELGVKDGLKLIAPLRLAQGSTPLWQYIRHFKEGIDSALQRKINELELQKAADILLVSQRYVELLVENDHAEARTLELLREETKRYGYDKEVLAGVEQVLFDQKLMASMHAAD